MRFRTLVATWAGASLSLSALATAASANGIVFDSLDGVTSSAAFAGGIESVISGTFNTKAAPVHVDVALLLRDRFPGFGEPGDTYAVSLDGGIPLSDLSFDPIGGVGLCQRVFRRLSGAGDRVRYICLDQSADGLDGQTL
jgi:hypothetical protein